MKKRVLITSVAGLTGLVVSKSLLKDENLILFGTDIVERIIGLQEKINFHVSPNSSAPEYFDFVSNFIKKNKIDIIIPVSSHDVDFFSLHKNSLNKNCKILILDLELHDKFNNKLEAYKILKEVGIRTPKVYVNDSALNFPLVIKPIRSTGSRDTFEIKNMKDYIYYTGEFKDYFISQYIWGGIYM